ncbi:hypothetical protein ACWPKO_23535 (plasmid) [Coraliomargarita sp. W4R53]
MRGDLHRNHEADARRQAKVGVQMMTVAKPVEALGDAADEIAATDFAVKIVDAVAPRVPYRRGDLLTAVQRHVYWAHVVSGLPLEREFLFRRDVVAVAVQQLPMRSEASLGRRRAVLLRVSEALGVAERALPPLYGSEPSAPYSQGEVADMRVWAAVQRQDRRANAWALLGLGIGAGLSAAEVCGVMSRHIADGGTRVFVVGARERVVVVDADWRGALRGLQRMDPERPVFVPGVRFYKTKISDFVRVTHGDHTRPLPQRMRATWLVRRMSAGMPVQDLLYEAGVKSLDALARYDRFLPPPASATWPNSPECR